jgi:signal transduction histidine kinase
MLLQVLYNLIDNSLKHGMRVSEIQLDYIATETDDKIIYSDNGIGVPTKSKERIFANTFSADGKSGHELYLVRKIIEEYSWSIKETGTPEEGARFEITIPKPTQPTAMPKVTSVEEM